MHKLVSPLVLFFIVLNSSALAYSSSHSEIIKSPNDQRIYHSLTLTNNLTVLLISDPSTDKSAAAIDVNVGSADDPLDALGLAHFLEHMLFLGTQKYPDPDEYQKFISDHGGSHNAFTTLDHTNYFFDVSAEHFEGALDRFAEQFTSPLFNEDYVEREKNAVHSEFSAKIKDDYRRTYSAFQTLLSKNHPYRKFSVGNLETLKDQPSKSIRDTLLSFYRDHYSANQMKLVILGKEPIAKLQSWAVSKFSNIPDHEVKVEAIVQPFFDQGLLPSKIEVKSIMDTRTMKVAFPIPSDFQYIQTKPISYLANLLGHEGPGSLLSALKSAQLVDSLGAGSQFDTKHNAIFTVTMALTEEGLKQQEKVLSYLFAYIDLIKQQGIQQSYFDEQAKMLDISFNYQEKSEPIHYVSNLATALQDTSINRVLFDDYDLSEYRPELYARYINYLKPENMLVAITAKSLEGALKTEWYETPYQVSKLPDDLVRTLSSTKNIAELKLPEKNIFIPEDTTLLALGNQNIPDRLNQIEGMDLWYAADTTYGTPKANLFVTIRSPLTTQSPTNLNLTELMVALLNDTLNEFSYPAYLAGLNYELYNHVRGITIKISGYNDKQSALLNKILLTIKNAEFSAERFTIAKERLMRSLQNEKDKKPYEQAITEARTLLMTPSWTDDERIAALPTITLKELEQFRQAFFNVIDTAVLSTGNVTRATALNIGNQIESIMLTHAKKQPVERPRVVDLEGTTSWYEKVSVTHPDTGFVYYLQGDNQSFEERAKFMLLDQIIATDYYAEIRTDKQLGYIVFATYFNLLEIPGLAFIVQSPTVDGPTLLNETAQFLTKQAQRLEQLDAKNLARYQSAVVSNLLKKENTLYEKSNRYWSEIDNMNFNFDTRTRLANLVQSLTVKDVRLFFAKLTERKGNSFLIYTEKAPTEENADGKAVDDKVVDDKGVDLKLLTKESKENLRLFTDQTVN